MALLRASEVLKKLKTEDADEQVGVRIIQKALEEPIRVIAENAGMDGSIAIDKVRNSTNPNFGLNADTGEYVDLIKAGVIDPVKVTRTALQNAASIASLLLTTEVLVSDIPEKREKMPAMPSPEY